MIHLVVYAVLCLIHLCESIFGPHSMPYSVLIAGAYGINAVSYRPTRVPEGEQDVATEGSRAPVNGMGAHQAPGVQRGENALQTGQGD